MFINKTDKGYHNLCGAVVEKRRKELKKSQRELADMLQIAGLDIDKNAVQRIEARKRFVTDIELVYLAKVLDVTYETLLSVPSEQT